MNTFFSIIGIIALTFAYGVECQNDTFNVTNATTTTVDVTTTAPTTAGSSSIATTAVIIASALLANL